MFILAAIGGIGYATLAYLGFKYANAAHGSILLSGLLPFEICVFSWLLLKEYPSANRKIGLVAIPRTGRGVAWRWKHSANNRQAG